MKRLLISLAAMLLAAVLHAQPQRRIASLVDSFYRANPRTVGITVHIESPERKLSWSGAAGYADKEHRQKLDAGQPLLIASNTKTFVATTILLLAEQHKLQLDEPIDGLVSRRSRGLLLAAGYNTRAITLRHLLSHTSGIDDYVDDHYLEFVNTNPNHQWTRDEQVQLATTTGKRLGTPGDTFHYADVNYLLLTEVIERYTGKPFYRAIRDLVNYKARHMDDTWFIKLECTPPGAAPLAHQYWRKFDWDSYNLDPSWDLYGGGGMAATPADLAVFFQQLFEGHIVKDQTLLAAMTADVHTKTPTNYCLGIRKVKIGGITGYYHGGFWGTDAIYFPDLHTAITICVLERSERDISATLCAALVALLRQDG